MKVIRVTKACRMMILLTPLLVFLPLNWLNASAFPTFEDVIAKNEHPPSIEDLTGGEVKPGDLIDINNVNLVKQFLTTGTYELIKMGMVLRMSPGLPGVDQIVPKTFLETTIQNMNKAVMDENGTTYYQAVGVRWPGGLPFVQPKNGLEVAANVKYGVVWDELRNYPNMIRFVNAKGMVYKKVVLDQQYIYCTTRTSVPPLGTFPGYEKVMYKRTSAFTFPLEIKGLGQYNLRYYDDTTEYDTGFAYLPAFKRTIRASATTWQDNMAGSDITYGDGQGLQEPYSDWEFKLLGNKFLLIPEHKSPFPLVNRLGRLDNRLHFDKGQKYPRVGWTIWPMHIVEGTPNIKHIYSKKMFYVHAWPYWPSSHAIVMTDNYDTQDKLWKVYIAIRGNFYVHNGETYTPDWGPQMYDVQSDHCSQMWYIQSLNQQNYRPEDITLKTLLETSR
ncbi:MAG: DUF1329 domain-containing protein [Thermodesulfobacteriota bacterium]|nr:DUF1329 domain-containing protein [Thermodesulfobacteriota bacterium]